MTLTRLVLGAIGVGLGTAAGRVTWQLWAGTGSLAGIDWPGALITGAFATGFVLALGLLATAGSFLLLRCLSWRRRP